VKKAFFVFTLAATAANAQIAADGGIISRERSVTIVPLYQTWSVAGNKTSELSLPAFGSWALSRQTNFTFWGSYASARGDGLPKLSGLTDTQLSLNHYWEQRHLLLSLRLNFPSGKNEFTPQEFTTSTQISYPLFNFQIPILGEGFNLAPALTWAIPVRENLVVGLGASYQFKGAYSPLAGIQDYKPGNELLFNGGFDLRLSATTVLSGDVIFTAYAADKIAAVRSFDSGNKVVANVQFRQYLGYNELWLFARYRSKAKNSLPAAGGALVSETEKTAPDQIEWLGHYSRRLTKRLATKFLLEGKSYQDTPAAFDGVALFGLGLAPELALSPAYTIIARAKYFAGKFKNGDAFSGMEAGAGMAVKF
jgi:hypothetical protein